MSTLKVACIQNCATADVDHNIDVCLKLTREAASAGARLIALPEYFSGLRTEGPRIVPVAFRETEHPVIPAFAAAARLSSDISGTARVVMSTGGSLSSSSCRFSMGDIALTDVCETTTSSSMSAFE